MLYHSQLERKRHIGNDIVVIIFIDYDTSPEEAIQTAMNFNPKFMRSHFNHIFALVTYDATTDRYQVSVCSAESVPFFGPPLPYFGEFSDHVSFRDFLLAKCEWVRFMYIYIVIARVTCYNTVCACMKKYIECYHKIHIHCICTVALFVV